jgi:hypothetical protein
MLNWTSRYNRVRNWFHANLTNIQLFKISPKCCCVLPSKNYSNARSIHIVGGSFSVLIKIFEALNLFQRFLSLDLTPWKRLQSLLRNILGTLNFTFEIVILRNRNHLDFVVPVLVVLGNTWKVCWIYNHLMRVFARLNGIISSQLSSTLM